MVTAGGRIVIVGHILIFGLCCQCKQLQTSQAATRGRREVHTVEKITREHTIAKFCTMVLTLVVRNCCQIICAANNKQYCINHGTCACVLGLVLRDPLK